MLLRAGNRVDIELPDLISLRLEGEGIASPCCPLVLVMRTGKTNQTGKVDQEPFPDLLDRKSWYHTPLLMRTTSTGPAPSGPRGGKKIAYLTPYDQMAKCFQAVGIQGSSVTHLPRSAGGGLGPPTGADWTVKRCYLSSICREAQAGFEKEVGSFYVPRDKEEPPPELLKLIWPELDGFLMVRDAEQLDPVKPIPEHPLCLAVPAVPVAGLRHPAADVPHPPDLGPRRLPPPAVRSVRREGLIPALQLAGVDPRAAASCRSTGGGSPAAGPTVGAQPSAGDPTAGARLWRPSSGLCEGTGSFRSQAVEARVPRGLSSPTMAAGSQRHIRPWRTTRIGTGLSTLRLRGSWILPDRMSRQATTVAQLYTEWFTGLGDKPSAVQMDRQFGTKWRSENKEKVFYSVQKTIIYHVEDRHRGGESLDAVLRHLQGAMVARSKGLQALSIAIRNWRHPGARKKDEDWYDGPGTASALG
ncbi:Transcriptional activator of glycolytic enzymes domain containing protein [Elaphomyces granulatus]